MTHTPAQFVALVFMIISIACVGGCSLEHQAQAIQTEARI